LGGSTPQRGRGPGRARGRSVWPPLLPLTRGPQQRAGRVPIVRLATWNVNSLKVRMPRVEACVAEVAPDVVCLQETKLSDSAFPHLAFAALGYETAHHGQGQWNGVAILSKGVLGDVALGLGARV